MSTTFPDTLEPTTISQPPRSRAGLNLLILLPILLATAFSYYISLYSIAFRFTRPYPLTPWESEMMIDAWRFNNGQPIYEDVAKGGHATHMYGPLSTLTVAALSKITGPSLYTGRAVNLAAGLIFCVLVVWLLCRRRFLELFVGFGLAIALLYRCRAYFTETRPDVAGLMFATIAVFLFYVAEERARRLLYIPATILVLVAMYYKQTYAAAAGVPIVAIFMRWPPDPFKRMLIAATPLFVVIAAVLLMKLAAPVLYFYMIEIGKMYEIRSSRLVQAAYGLLTLTPFFYAMVIAFSLDRKRDEPDSGKFTWLAAAVIVGTVAGIAPFAKRGGTYNSFLLAWAPMTAFCIAVIGWLFDKLRDARKEVWPRLLASCAAGATMFATTYCVPKAEVWGFTGAHGDKTYDAAIKAARKLSGTVISIDDPTIAFRAKGYVGRCADCELDASGRMGDDQGWYRITAGLAGEIEHADWIIRTHSSFDIVDPKQFKIHDQTMAGWGFKREKFLPGKTAYSLWHRQSPATLPTTRPAAGTAVDDADSR